MNNTNTAFSSLVMISISYNLTNTLLSDMFLSPFIHSYRKTPYQVSNIPIFPASLIVALRYVCIPGSGIPRLKDLNIEKFWHTLTKYLSEDACQFTLLQWLWNYFFPIRLPALGIHILFYFLFFS